jgi:hypothetical protein
MSIWGAGVPRWVPALGIGIGIWYIIVGAIVSTSPTGPIIALIFGAIGVATIAGCIYRLRITDRR